MRKPFFALVALFFCTSIFAQSNDWYVQVGVFDRKVDINYFNRIGSDVYYSKDAYGFHRYYKGVYKSETEAKGLVSKFNDMGFNSYVKSKDQLTNTCVCNSIPLPKSILNSIESIFFDFDRSNLRSESRTQLNDLVSTLNEFPSYKTILRAHTDSKGSQSYNEALSLRRANSAKQYLISRGIASSRISTETFGEDDPIAKNELNGGQDTEQGRQFNRRVEIIITNSQGDILSEMVDEIEVPNDLEN
ncbi:MAG: OmpA family protein [Bacteroidota bacterium]